MLKLSSLRRCAICVIAAYLLMALEWPTAAQADEKSSKSKTEGNSWPRKHHESDKAFYTQLKVALVILGIAMVATIIKKIVEHHGDEDGQENEAQKISDQRVDLGDSSQVLSMQIELRKNERKLLPCLPVTALVSGE